MPTNRGVMSGFVSASIFDASLQETHMSMIKRIVPLVLLAAAVGCEDVEGDTDDHGHSHDENEVITTVVLTFSPTGGGDDLVFRWADPDNDANPTIDDIVLADADDYSLSMTFLNELEDPAEDITEEINDEDDEHQVFFTGSAVQSPATGANGDAILTQQYSDQDGGGLPIGLTNAITTLGTGTGDLTVTLRHLPPEDGEAVKIAGLAEAVAAGGFGAIGGDNDVQVTLPVEVQ